MRIKRFSEDRLTLEEWTFMLSNEFSPDGLSLRLIRYTKGTRQTTRHKKYEYERNSCWSWYGHESRNFWNGYGLRFEDVPRLPDGEIKAEFVKRLAVKWEDGK